MYTGIGIGVIEILCYLMVSFLLRYEYTQYQDINLISFCWLTMTVLTGYWEYVYITNYKKVQNAANLYIKNKESTWTNKYTLDYVLPWKLSEIFYTEYAAHADREYMSNKDIWSRTIEGSHEFCCGLFSLIGLISKHYNNNNLYLLSIGISMGTQFMNSLLYSVNYFIQTKDPNSPNFVTKEFPLGFALSKRPFFWVNLAWLLFPMYVLINLYVINI